MLSSPPSRLHRHATPLPHNGSELQVAVTPADAEQTVSYSAVAVQGFAFDVDSTL